MKDFFYVYNIRPLNCNLIIFYSKDFSRIHKHLNLKINKPVSDWILKHVKDIKIPEGDGGVFYTTETNKPLILFIKRKKRGWPLFETLVHELSHLLDNLEIYFGFEKESEFRAYLTEDMFRDISKILKIR